MAKALDIAIEHHRAGRLAEAEPIYRQLLAAQPRDAHLLHLLGLLLLQEGRPTEAADPLRTAAIFAPGSYQTYVLLAQAARLTGKHAEAQAAATHAIAIRPLFAPAHNELGLALVQQGKTDDAIAAWQRAVSLKADYAEAYSNLGAALSQADRLEEGAAALQKAVELNPNHAPAHNNFASTLDALHRTDQAIAQWQRALELQPGFFDALLNLGKAVFLRGDYGDAEALLARAMAVQPGEPHVRFLRGLIHLVHGRLREGFAEYEYRTQSSHFDLKARAYLQPKWDGGHIRGKAILLYAEQGLGDMIQFVRYAPLLAERGAEVIVESPGPLVELLRTVSGVKQVVPAGAALPPFDVHASVVSLPLLFGTTLETIPATIPYINPSPDRVDQWTDVLGRSSGTRRVGLVWSGNPDHTNDARRSIPLHEFGPIFNVGGITCFSLQKGPAAEQIDRAGLQAALIDHTEDLNDFADTAALISQLDLVITVDTSVAHLAGAMGKPVWVLITYVPDWRWLLERTDSPWYPTMRLFRQPRMDDWPSVIQEVASELRYFPGS